MKENRCVRCGAHFRTASVQRVGIVRDWAAFLAQAKGYPLMYRLLDSLPLCAGCLEMMPVIGEAVCRGCGRDSRLAGSFMAEAGLCRDCQTAKPSALRGNRSLLRYDEWGRELLALYKYRGDERLAELFSLLLVIALHRSYPSLRFDCLTPVPLHVKRLRERGFNQMELIAERVGRACKLPVHQLLERTRDTKKLSQQPGRLARRQSIHGAFAARRADVFFSSGAASAGAASVAHPSEKSRAILLLDDVYTTGSTLRECADVLERSQSVKLHIYSLTIFR